MSPAARRSWLFALFWLAFVGGALLEYLLPPADAGLAGALTHEAAARMLYAAAALALGGLAAVLPRERHCLTPLSIGAIMAAFLVALNNFPIATLLVHRTATVTAPKEAVLAFLSPSQLTALLLFAVGVILFWLEGRLRLPAAPAETLVLEDDTGAGGEA